MNRIVSVQTTYSIKAIDFYRALLQLCGLPPETLPDEIELQMSPGSSNEKDIVRFCLMSDKEIAEMDPVWVVIEFDAKDPRLPE